VNDVYQKALEEEEELLGKQKNLQRELQVANSIITDDSERLQLAINKKDNLDIDRAIILIECDNTKSKTISAQVSRVTEDLIKIKKNEKINLINNRSEKKTQLTHQSISNEIDVLL
jgi:hypothetical protein